MCKIVHTCCRKILVNKMRIFILLTVLSACNSARILGIFPFPGRSHYILGSALMRALAEHGHDVAVISPYGEKIPPKGTNYMDIVLKKTYEDMEEKRNSGDFNMFSFPDLGPFLAYPIMALIMADDNHLIFQEPAVQDFMKTSLKFDVIIIEEFYRDAAKALVSHFEGAQILFNSIGPNYDVNSLVGNPSPPSYVPDTMLSYSEPLTFCERLTNFLIYLMHEAIHHLYLYPTYNAIAHQYLPNAPHLSDILYNVSLVLVNSHPSMSGPVPHVPNVIDIGGFHIKPPQKLPDDLQEFLDSAKDGVIYFSMGSNLKSADLPTEKREALVKVFGKLKQKVLWKWEDDVLPGQPSNVKLGKWLPQQDILAHPNIKLFITHGGMLSTTEAIYHGVPILAIPVYGDQKLNAQKAMNNGYGLTLPFKELTETTLSEKIHELISNPKYFENAKHKSVLFHDRPVKPMDTAIYWVEYVARHKGAPHLRVAGVDLPWYQYFLLDVIAVILLAVGSIILVLTYVVKKICLKIRKSFSKKKEEKVKKN